MKSFFNVVINAMFDHVNDQMELMKQAKAPAVKVSVFPTPIQSQAYRWQTVVLCGGLANSKYIASRMEEYCEAKFDGNIKVKVPSRPSSAVARGAVLLALRPHMIEHRKCSQHIGIEEVRPFVRHKDKESDVFEDPVKGKMAKGYIKWLIPKVCYPL